MIVLNIITPIIRRGRCAIGFIGASPHFCIFLSSTKLYKANHQTYPSTSKKFLKNWKILKFRKQFWVSEKGNPWKPSFQSYSILFLALFYRRNYHYAPKKTSTMHHGPLTSLSVSASPPLECFSSAYGNSAQWRAIPSGNHPDGAPFCSEVWRDQVPFCQKWPTMRRRFVSNSSQIREWDFQLVCMKRHIFSYS